MEPTNRILSSAQAKIKEALQNKKKSSLTSENVSTVTASVLKYPINFTVKKLDSTLEIKQIWLYNEWAPECQFSKFIKLRFPDRKDLDPQKESPNKQLIQATFKAVRGDYSLWGSMRENARWKKIIVADLKLEWVLDNVEVLYPSEEQFKVSELNGLVLWDDKDPSNHKKYKLYEGNHRISAWLASQTPQSLSAIIFIGKPAKKN